MSEEKKTIPQSAESSQANQIVVLEPVDPLIGRIIPVLSTDEDNSIHRASSDAEAIQIAMLVAPCVALLSINSRQDVLRATAFLKGIQELLWGQNIKIILVSKFDDERISDTFFQMGCNEFVQSTASPDTLHFKIRLHAKSMRGKRKEMNSDLRLVTLGKDGKTEEDSMSPSQGEADGLYVMEIAQDIWLFKGETPKKIGTQWIVHVEGPDPLSGEWVEGADDGKNERKWFWKSRNEAGDDVPAEDVQVGWEFSGQKPALNPDTGKWKFVGSKPTLAYVKKGQGSVNKMAPDGKGGILVAKDAPDAEGNLEKLNQIALIAKEKQKKKTSMEASPLKESPLKESDEGRKAPGKIPKSPGFAAPGKKTLELKTKPSRESEGDNPDQEKISRGLKPEAEESPEKDGRGRERTKQALTHPSENKRTPRESPFAPRRDSGPGPGKNGEGFGAFRNLLNESKKVRIGKQASEDSACAPEKKRSEDASPVSTGKGESKPFHLQKKDAQAARAKKATAEPGKDGEPAEKRPLRPDSEAEPGARADGAPGDRDGPESAPFHEEEEELRSSARTTDPQAKDHEPKGDGKTQVNPIDKPAVKPEDPVEGSKEASAPDARNAKGPSEQESAGKKPEKKREPASKSFDSESKPLVESAVTDSKGARSSWRARNNLRQKDGGGKEGGSVEKDRCHEVQHRSLRKKGEEKERNYLEYPAGHFGSEQGVWEKVRDLGFVFVTPEFRRCTPETVREHPPYWYVYVENGEVEPPFFYRDRLSWLFEDHAPPERAKSFGDLPFPFADYLSEIARGKSQLQVTVENQGKLKQEEDRARKTLELPEKPAEPADKRVKDFLKDFRETRKKIPEQEQAGANELKAKPGSAKEMRSVSFFVSLSDKLGRMRPEELYAWLTAEIGKVLGGDATAILAISAAKKDQATVVASSRTEFKVGQVLSIQEHQELKSALHSARSGEIIYRTRSGLLIRALYPRRDPMENGFFWIQRDAERGAFQQSEMIFINRVGQILGTLLAKAPPAQPASSQKTAA